MTVNTGDVFYTRVVYKPLPTDRYNYNKYTVTEVGPTIIIMDDAHDIPFRGIEEFFKLIGDCGEVLISEDEYKLGKIE
jgi:hypothetical protein